MKIFGERLKEKREEKDLSQGALASLIGAGGRQQIAGWEDGGQPRDLAMVPRLCEVLEVSADYLLGVEQPERQSMAGLSPRHIEAARNLAAMPRSIQDTLIALLEELEPMKRQGMIDQILSYDTDNPNHAKLMDDIENWQRRYRRKRAK